ncbi:MAG: hypothetical protein R3B49_07665 [Phycisphaerales bacterium]
MRGAHEATQGARAGSCRPRPPRVDRGADRQGNQAFQGRVRRLEGLTELGHDVTILGVEDRIEPIGEAVRDLRPHVVFNLLEEFARDPRSCPTCSGTSSCSGMSVHRVQPDRHDVLERQGARRVLRQHRVRVPAFFVVAWGEPSNARPGCRSR